MEKSDTFEVGDEVIIIHKSYYGLTKRNSKIIRITHKTNQIVCDTGDRFEKNGYQKSTKAFSTAITYIKKVNTNEKV